MSKKYGKNSFFVPLTSRHWKIKKGMFAIAHQQNTIHSKALLHCIMYQQTIILRQLFAGHMVGGLLAMKRITKIHWMIIEIQLPNLQLLWTSWGIKLYSLTALYRVVLFKLGHTDGIQNYFVATIKVSIKLICLLSLKLFLSLDWTCQ